MGSNSEVAAPLQRLKLITAMFDDEVVGSTVYKNAMEEVKIVTFKFTTMKLTL